MFVFYHFLFPNFQCDGISLYNEWKCLAWNIPLHFTTRFPTYQCTPWLALSQG